MARHGTGKPIGWVPVDRMTTPFPEEVAAVSAEMADQVDALHSTGTASDSRTTSWPSDSCLASSLLALTMS